MSTVAEVNKVAKKTGRPKGDRNDVTVRIDAQLKMDAETIANRRGMDLNVFLSEFLRPLIDKEKAIEAAKMANEVGIPVVGPKKKPKR